MPHRSAKRSPRRSLGLAFLILSFSGAVVAAPPTALLPVGPDSDLDGVPDSLDAAPSDASIAFRSTTPAPGEWRTIAFDEGWPWRGDLDFNDVVVRYRIVEETDASNALRRIHLALRVVAVGVTEAMGVGLVVPGISPAQVGSLSLDVDAIPQAIPSPMPGATDAVVRILDDLGGAVGATPGASWIATASGSGGAQIELTLELASPVLRDAVGQPPYDLFVYRRAEPGVETHLPGHPPSELSDPTLLGTGDDAHGVAGALLSVTREGLPWGLELPGAWAPPAEGVDLLEAYPRGVDWVESGGAVEFDWAHWPEAGLTLPVVP